jgi:small subunit ribosomal protein S11
MAERERNYYTKQLLQKEEAKRIVPSGQLHVKATFNNTIITVTDKKGEVVATASAGACGFRGSKKGTAYAAQVASEKALGTTQSKINGLRTIDVYVRGIGQGRDAAIRAAARLALMLKVLQIKLVSRTAVCVRERLGIHNGQR